MRASPFGAADLPYDASFGAGLSGPSRLHDMFVAHEAMLVVAYRGAGLAMSYGVHVSPFGRALVVVHQGRLAGLDFAESGGGDAALAEFRQRWPRARLMADQGVTQALAERVFDQSQWRAGTPLRIVLIGSDFQIRTWEALLETPFGGVTTYSDVATRLGNPGAARAVGAAVGRNPISFVVPCHRVIGKGGNLTGYHWGLPRKRAILQWEAGIAIES